MSDPQPTAHPSQPPSQEALAAARELCSLHGIRTESNGICYGGNLDAEDVIAARLDSFAAAAVARAVDAALSSARERVVKERRRRE